MKLKNDGAGSYVDNIALMPSGYVGIGTNVPQKNLEVSTASGNTTLRIITAIGASSKLRFEERNSLNSNDENSTDGFEINYNGTSNLLEIFGKQTTTWVRNITLNQSSPYAGFGGLASPAAFVDINGNTSAPALLIRSGSTSNDVLHLPHLILKYNYHIVEVMNILIL